MGAAGQHRRQFGSPKRTIANRKAEAALYLVRAQDQAHVTAAWVAERFGLPVKVAEGLLRGRT